LANSATIPILKELIPDGIDYGTILLAEFEADSIWYDASLSIAAQALKDGIKTDYHTFQRDPNEIGRAIEKFGLDVPRLQEEGLFRILDSYTLQTKLAEPQRPPTLGKFFQTTAQSLNLSDWGIAAVQEVKSAPELEKRRLHIDDDTSVLLQYNPEKAAIDYMRTRGVPGARALGIVFLLSTVLKVHSEAFYKQFESLCDGIIEFKKEDSGGTRNDLVRVKAMRGRKYDRQWHRLMIGDNFEVTLEK
jgi:KaiC/GvpD/RAD55 family RecA-like ATPase